MKLPNDQPLIFLLDMVVDAINVLLLIPNDFLSIEQATSCFSLFVNLISCCRNDDACDGCEDVEEAIGQVGERRHIENRGLRHAAGAPGNKDRGNGA